MDNAIKKSFDSVKEELEDHLISINENTSEIEKVYKHLDDIEEKIDKLNEKIEAIQLTLQEETKKQELTANEQKVFLILYTFGEKNPLSYTDIARKLNMTELEIKETISSMISKNIPITTHIIDGITYFSIDKEFRQKQAKENILQIDPEITQGLFEKRLNYFFH